MAIDVAPRRRTVRDLNAQESLLLDTLQTEFPVCDRPYQALGKLVGLSEADVLAKVRSFREDRIIRQISAIFDTRSLGYKSSLIALKVDADRVDEAGEIINQHPGVSHNYKRNHDFNIWYTVAVPPESSVEMTVDKIHALTGAERSRLLPTLKLFKIGVELDIQGTRAAGERKAPVYSEADRNKTSKRPLTIEDRRFVSVVQDDLEVVEQPFAIFAERLGITSAALFAYAADLRSSGYLRRFAAILFHRDAGFKVNPMVVWHVPEDKVDELGAQLASFSAVSHCYRRPIYEDWRYNVFTMLHGRKLAECEAVVLEMEAVTGLTDRALLFSTKEYKKIRTRYFTGEIEEWERAHFEGKTLAEIQAAS